jgi:hypothetical protein
MLSLLADPPAPTMLPLYFLSQLLINPIYTHIFCLDSSMLEHKNQGLLKTPFAINKAEPYITLILQLYYDFSFSKLLPHWERIERLLQ